MANSKLTLTKAIERSQELHDFAREQYEEAEAAGDWGRAGRLHEAVAFQGAVTAFLAAQDDVPPGATEAGTE